MTAFLLHLSLLLAIPDSTHILYAQKDARALAALCAHADAREMQLRCRYRLYPLTEDERYVTSLPEALDDASARELALLSGLWGYRAARASMLKALRYGLRTDRLLEQAKALDPLDPFVLLIEGQSLLFRPGFAGRDERAALDRFQKLKAVAARELESGVTEMEAELWIWYTLERLGDARADSLRARLLAQHPPLLHREFLERPPR